MDNIALIQTNVQSIFSHPTWDIVSVFAVAAIGFFYGIAAGKTRIAATLLYTYVAYAVFSALPVEQLLVRLNFVSLGVGGFFGKSVLFLVLFLILALALGTKLRKGMARAGAWWQIFLLSFLQAGLFIHLIVTMLPPEIVVLFAPVTKTVFANPNVHVWWLVVPLLILVVLKRLESQER